MPVVRRSRRLRRGDTLFRKGDAFDALYAVCSGAIKTVVPDVDNQPIGFSIPGELIGIAGLTARRHTADAVALEASEVCEIPFRSVVEAMDNLPPLRRMMFQLFADQLAHDEALIIPLVGKKSATERLSAYLVSLAARYEARGFSGTDIPLPMSHSDLSKHLGLAKETVCRLFARLARDRLITVDGRRLRITDRARLAQLAGAA